MDIRYHSYRFLIILLFVCSGCMPYQFTTRPGVMGAVIDSTNNQPVDGATVTLTTLRSIEHKGESLSTTTGADGNFEIPAAQKWSLYIVPLDPYSLSALVTIKMLGYQDMSKEITTLTTGKAMTDLGVVPIERQVQDTYGPESVGAIPLIESQRFPEKYQGALAVVIAELKKDGDVPSDFSAKVEESKRGIEFHLWHKSAFLPENRNKVGNPGGLCRTMILRDGAITSKLWWQ